MMTADINREQLILLAQCVLFGAGAGLCYDVFRAARRVLCRSFSARRLRCVLAAHRAGRGIQWCFQWASAEKIREIRKKVCKTPFHFSRKRYKIKSKSVQRQER